MKNILVTGGLGYIGSHTVVELINNNYKPVVIDNLDNSELKVLEGLKKICQKDISFYNCDVLNTDRVTTILREENIDAVIHFAAHKAVGESVEKPLKYYKNNIDGLISLLYGMQSLEIKNLVFSSSCTVYGEPDHSPVDETAPIKKATSPYGNTKQIGEEIIQDVKPLNAVVLRYFNPIGAHPSSLIGELPLGIPNNLVPYITQTAAGIREKLTVFGSDYNTKDGTCVRDYIHVVDLAKAHVKALDFIKKNPDSHVETINIGNGLGYTVLEIIETFEKINNLKLNYSIGPRRAGDVEKVWADPKKAKEVLKWESELNLEDMLKSAWEWQKTL
jgi:UDP-glucose 4-epimerase